MNVLKSFRATISFAAKQFHEGTIVHSLRQLKPLLTQLVSKVSTFYGTRWIITVFTRACHWSRVESWGHVCNAVHYCSLYNKTLRMSLTTHHDGLQFAHFSSLCSFTLLRPLT